MNQLAVKGGGVKTNKAIQLLAAMHLLLIRTFVWANRTGTCESVNTTLRNTLACTKTGYSGVRKVTCVVRFFPQDLQSPV